MNLGIDIGTSYTKIGMVDGQGKFINILGPGRALPTTVVWVPRTGRLYFGAEARNIRETEARVGKFFKIEIKRNPHYRLGPYGLGEILTGFLAFLREQYIEGKVPEPVETVTMGVPNYFGLNARRFLIEAARRVFREAKVRLVLEPLAALAGLFRDRALAGEPPLLGNIAVLDVGGGTADISFVHISRDKGVRAVLEAQVHAGSDAFSGSEVDKAFLRQVFFPRFEVQTGQVIPASMKKEKGMTPREEYQYTRMLGWAEQAKLKISESGRAWLDIPGFYEEYSFCAALDQEDLAAALKTTLSHLREFLEGDARIRGQQLGLYSGGRWDIDTVVLTGGASRLEGVKHLVAELGNDILEPSEPELYVVKGLSQPADTRKGWAGLQMKAILPLSFYVEKVVPGGSPSTILERIPFDTANLELEPGGVYRLCSISVDSPYNLARNEGMFRVRVYQGETGGEAQGCQARVDTESLVLDVSRPVREIKDGVVNIFLDLAGSRLSTDMVESDRENEMQKMPGADLWERALARQEETQSIIRALQVEWGEVADNFAERVRQLRKKEAYFQNYDDLVEAKLLAFFEVLSK